MHSNRRAATLTALSLLATFACSTIGWGAHCPLDEQLQPLPGAKWNLSTAQLAIAHCAPPTLTVVRRSNSRPWTAVCEAWPQDIAKSSTWQACAAPPACSEDEARIKHAKGRERLEAWKKRCSGRKTAIPIDEDPKCAVAMRSIDTIIVHETESRQSFGPHELQQAHRERGFDDIGYHYLIAKTASGWRIFEGRPESTEGAHAGSGLNGGSIGIAIAGDYRAQSNPGTQEEDVMPPPQAVMLLKALITDLRARHPAIQAVYGHGEHKRKFSGCDTDCPSVPIQRLVEVLRGSASKP